MGIKISIRTQIAFAGQFIALFGGAGIILPFWPYWLDGKGLSAGEIATILAVCTAARVVFAPALSALADATGRRRLVLFGVGCAFAAGLVPFFGISGFWVILPLWTVVGTLFTTMIPMSDSLSVMAVRQQGLDYGRARLWGSVSFIVVSTLAGWFLTGRSHDMVLWMLLAAAVAICSTILLLPDMKSRSRGRAATAFSETLRQPGFVGFLAVISLLLASHAVLYGFATLHWTSAGHSETLVGILWAEAVILEVVVFAYGSRLLRRFNVTGLLLCAALGGALRWTILGLSTDLGWLFLAQALHACTFAMAHLAAVTYIARRMPDHLGTTAQGLFDACAMGVVFAIAMWGGGFLYETVTAKAFWAMAAMSATGGLILVVRWRDLAHY